MQCKARAPEPDLRVLILTVRRFWGAFYLILQHLKDGLTTNPLAYPLPRLVFEEGSDDGVESVNVPGLIHKVDPSESGRKTVLWETRANRTGEHDVMLCYFWRSPEEHSRLHCSSLFYEYNVT